MILALDSAASSLTKWLPERSAAMVIVHLKRGGSIEVREGDAVAPGTFPTTPGNDPAGALQVVTADGRVLAVFRTAEVEGYPIET